MLFGEFALVQSIPAIGVPDAEVWSYRPPNRRSRVAFEPFAPRRWWAVATDLWLAHDGEFLLIATPHRSATTVLAPHTTTPNLTVVSD